MSQRFIRLLLLLVIIGELGVAGWYAANRLGRTEPPLPDLTGVDPVTAGELRDLAVNCHTPGDWVTLGEAYLATGFFPEAEACLRHAASLNPSAELAFKHAFALERIGHIEEANSQYQTAAARGHTRSADCWYYVGRNHLRLEQPAAAAESFRRAGTLPAARYELALLDTRAGRTAEAEAEAARLADEFPTAYQPVSLGYRLALMRKDSAYALVLADTFAHRPRPLSNPFDHEVRWIFGVADGVGRARLFRDAGSDVQAREFAAAEAKLRAALTARWDSDVADRLAEVVFVLGRSEEAWRILVEAVERGGPSSELLWRLGQAHDAVGRPAEALAAWERAARVATGTRGRYLWQDLAERYDQLGQREKASPLYARAYIAAGTDELDAGRLDSADTFLARAVKVDPGSAHAWFALGECRRAANRAQDARVAYQKCLQLDPDHGRATRALKLVGK